MMFFARVFLIPFLFCLLFTSCSFASSDSNTPNVFILKRVGKLLVYKNRSMVASFPVQFGSGDNGFKVRQGDKKTPEGLYYIVRKNNESKFNRFLHLSYPNPYDAEAGLQKGLITESQYRAIVDAFEKKALPPQDTRLGGLVGIHGTGRKWDKNLKELGFKFNWTDGCIAMEDRDIEKLFSMIPVGTPVFIMK